MELKKRILSTVENHGKCDIAGIFNLYPRERRFSLYRAMFELRNDGWIKIKKYRFIGERYFEQVNKELF